MGICVIGIIMYIHIYIHIYTFYLKDIDLIWNCNICIIEASVMDHCKPIPFPSSFLDSNKAEPKFLMEQVPDLSI